MKKLLLAFLVALVGAHLGREARNAYDPIIWPAYPHLVQSTYRVEVSRITANKMHVGTWRDNVFENNVFSATPTYIGTWREETRDERITRLLNVITDALDELKEVTK